MPAPIATNTTTPNGNELRMRHAGKSQPVDATVKPAGEIAVDNTAEPAKRTLTTPAYMTPVDDMFIRTDAPERNYGVSSILWVEGDIKVETMLSIMQRFPEHQPKLRQRCVRGDSRGASLWVDVDDHSRYGPNDTSPPLDHLWSVRDQLAVVHFDPTTIPEGADVEQYEKRWVEDCVSKHVTGGFDPRLPLWRALLMRGLSNNRSVVGTIFHHCIADGQGFAHLMAQVMVPVDGAPAVKPKKPAVKPEKPKRALIAEPTQGAAGAMESLQSFAMAVHHYLEYLVLAVIQFILVVWYTTLAMVKVTFFRRHALRHVKPQREEKRVAWSKPMSIKDIGVIRRAYPGITLNDVMVACIERSYVAYMDELDREAAEGLVDPAILKERIHTRPQQFSMWIPKGFRAPNDSRFENLASLEYLVLPLLSNDASTSDTLANANKYMRQVKLSMFAPLLTGIATPMTKISPGFYSSPMTVAMTEYYLNQVFGVITNVPGSPVQLCLTDGVEKFAITSCVMYPPSMSVGATGIAVNSYNGDVTLGAITDDMPEYPEQANKIVDGAYAAFEKMLADARTQLKAAN